MNSQLCCGALFRSFASPGLDTHRRGGSEAGIRCLRGIYSVVGALALAWSKKTARIIGT